MSAAISLRYAVRIVELNERVLVRPCHVTRCPGPFLRLPEECVRTILSFLCWADAAHVAAVHTKWKAWLIGGWPRDQGPSPAHWVERKRFGSDWKERRPFVKPARWSAFEPGTPLPVLPSWTWALLPLVARTDGETRGKVDVGLSLALMSMLLSWLDRIERIWPGLAVTRWPGVARRIMYCIGADSPPLLLHEANGEIAREWPPGSGEVVFNDYRGGGTTEGASEPVGRCKFRLPAEAALFWALLPGGFGEHSYSDGMSGYAGFELALEPWRKDSSWVLRRSNTANLRRQSRSRLGADPKVRAHAHGRAARSGASCGLCARRRCSR